MIQLIYVSATTDLFPEQAMAEFLSAARERNQRRGITGIIVLHEGSVLQVIEGPDEAIDELDLRPENWSRMNERVRLI